MSLQRPVAALFLRVELPGINPPRVRPSIRCRQSSGVDSCCLLGTKKLEFLGVRPRWRDLLLGASGRSKGSTTITAVLGR